MEEERETQYRQEDGFYHYTPGYQPQPVKTGNSMSLASLVVGILALMLGFFGGVFGIVMGALGIILAILSRGKEKMPMQAKLGIGFSAFGAFLGILMLTAVLSLVSAEDFQEQLQDELKRYGYDFGSGEEPKTEEPGEYGTYPGDGSFGEYGFERGPEDMPGFGDDFNYWDFGDGMDGGYDSYGNGENIL